MLMLFRRRLIVSLVLVFFVFEDGGFFFVFDFVEVLMYLLKVWEKDFRKWKRWK